MIKRYSKKITVTPAPTAGAVLRVFPETGRSLTLARQGQVQNGARSNLTQSSRTIPYEMTWSWMLENGLLGVYL